MVFECQLKMVELVDGAHALVGDDGACRICRPILAVGACSVTTALLLNTHLH
jgi:hypothetical protein